ncbi:hypothetical protein ACFWBC_36565 [Streptomyces sp. NPDC059985]|uniref:hypothetical protein n=1 Tax=Streptomyces sp. NPDC059985 TaxID=3347025 RepID=UPI0036CE84A1
MKDRARIALPRITPSKPVTKETVAPSAERERGTIPLREGWTVPDEWSNPAR